jgi:hypothetical protein
MVPASEHILPFDPFPKVPKIDPPRSCSLLLRDVELTQYFPIQTIVYYWTQLPLQSTFFLNLVKTPFLYVFTSEDISIAPNGAFGPLNYLCFCNWY